MDPDRVSGAARHAIIAGAGIGGLTAALACARAGLRVSVIERAPQLEEAGAGVPTSRRACGCARRAMGAS
jgi:salicylate hydroxylase